MPCGSEFRTRAPNWHLKARIHKIPKTLQYFGESPVRGRTEILHRDVTGGCGGYMVCPGARKSVHEHDGRLERKMKIADRQEAWFVI